MCEPTMGLAIASALVQHSATNSAAQSQMDSASQSQQIAMNQYAEQQKQINQQSQLEQSERLQSGMVEQAKIKAIAGESGAIGFNTDRLVGESIMNQSADIASMETNRANTIKQSEWNKAAASQGAKNSMTQAKNNSSSVLATGLQIGSSVNTYYNE